MDTHFIGMNRHQLSLQLQHFILDVVSKKRGHEKERVKQHGKYIMNHSSFDQMNGCG